MPKAQGGARRPKRRARAAAKRATLSLQVQGGWAYVSINGESAGTTPLVGRTLRSGRHTIALARPDLSWVDRLTVVLRPGERRSVVVIGGR